MSKLRYLSNVVTLELDEAKCNGCAVCVTVCPHAVFAIRDHQAGRGQRARIVDRDACMECGACAKNCAPGAISVQSGVGCAAAIIIGALTGHEPSCGCSTGCG